MIPRNRRIIDLAAIEENMRLLRAATPSSAGMIAVVKADGYGHGAAETARAAIRGGADMLAVASTGEGQILREQGIDVPILVLGAVTESDVRTGVENELIQTVCTEEMIRLCETAAANLKKQTEVHLKIDTGMGRIGVRTPGEIEGILSVLNQCVHVRLGGVYTHFADADGDENGIKYTREQFELFMKLIKPLPGGIIRHCCNSAAIHRFPEMALDMVRAGISLYGYPPVPCSLSLRPCMTWVASISYIKEIPAGTSVNFRCTGEKGYILINGKRAKIIGRVCMDQMMADVTDIENVSEGDIVVLMGKDGTEQITAEDLAEWAGTISYEILLSAGNRVERIFR